MFRVFRVFRVCVCVWGVWGVNDTLEGQKGDQGGRPKNGHNFGWGKISTFWVSSSATKVFLTAEKVGSAQN